MESPGAGGRAICPADAEAAYNLLVVDDDDAHRRLIGHIFRPPEFQIIEALDAAQGLARLADQTFDVILVDYNLPDLTGLDMCRQLRRDPAHCFVPVIMLTGRDGPGDLADCLRAGACDYVRKPYHPLELEARVRAAAKRKRATQRLEDAETLLVALGQRVEARDPATGGHCQRLAGLGDAFALALGLNATQRSVLRRSAILHDLGKIAVPDAILLKPGPLTAEEWAVMKTHPVVGAELCGRMQTLGETVAVIRHHHERWDGSGYPDGLAGDDIPFLARVFQLLDVYDALCSERPYKPALPPEEALAIMAAEAREGKLDPRLADTFLTFMTARTADGHPEPATGTTYARRSGGLARDCRPAVPGDVRARR